MQTSNPLPGVTLPFVLCFMLLLFPGTSLGAVQIFAFEPIVISTNVIEPVVLSVQTDGSHTSLSLAFANGTERPLIHQGDGLYTITVTHEEALFDYQPDDVNRNFVGFLDVYDGETRAFRGNMFIDVEDDSIPEVIVADLSPQIRLSSHLVNFHLPDVDPRAFDWAEIVNLFYQHFPDDFDFLQIVSTPKYFGNRFYVHVQNYVTGTGVRIFDSSASFGSSGRLLGIVRFPITTFFDLAAKAYVHELGHHWINFSHSPKLQGVIPHWPISSLASNVMGFQTTGQGLEFPYDIIELPNDQYQLVHKGQVPTYFNAMELYLMGMVSAANAGSYIVFENQDQFPCGGCILDGPVVTYDVNDLVASEGERVPAFPNDRTDFRAATIIVSKYRLLTYREMKFFNHFAARGEATEELPSAMGFAKRPTVPFNPATMGVGALSTTISSRLADTIFRNGFEQ